MGKFKYLYDSREDNIFEEFFRPAFEIYDEIRISSCYVSTKILLELVDEIKRIEMKNGFFYLMFDLNGNSNTTKTLSLLSNTEIGQIIFEEIFSNLSIEDIEKYQELARLIQNETIVIKVVNQDNGGLYHVKEYVFSNHDMSDIITATGSANFTTNGTHSINSESLVVEDIPSRCFEVFMKVTKNWNDESLGTNIKEIKETILKEMKQKIQDTTVKIIPFTKKGCFDNMSFEEILQQIKQLDLHYHLFCDHTYFDELITNNISNNISIYSASMNINLKNIIKVNSNCFYNYNLSIFIDTENGIQCLLGDDTIDASIYINNEFQIRKKQLTLFDHQKAALESLALVDKGILEMATGSGKTITMIEYVINNYSNKNNILIVVPLRALAEQWVETFEELTNFNIIKAWGDYNWIREFNYKFTNPLIKNKIIIAVDKTFYGQKFQSMYEKYEKDTILIVDEMHKFTNINILGNKVNQYTKVFGLSASPFENKLELTAKEKLQKDFFGDVIFEFTLKDAIDKEILCEYYYFPHKIFLTESESKIFTSINQKIINLLTKETLTKQESDILAALNVKRKMLLSTCDEKFDAFSMDFLENEKRSKNAIIYCPSGSSDYYNSNEEYILSNLAYYMETMNEMYYKKYNKRLICRKFTSHEVMKDRINILDQFKKQNIRCLAAIKCLDEGIDIPNAENVFILESSSSTREFIQRRGRILRQSKGKEYANIYDYIVYQYDGSPIESEIKRQNEFERLSKYEL